MYTLEDMVSMVHGQYFLSLLYSLIVVSLWTSISLKSFKMMQGNEEMKKNDAMEYYRSFFSLNLEERGRKAA